MEVCVNEVATGDDCPKALSHDWELVKADRIPHEHWPPYAELVYRCRHCQSQRRFRQTLRK